MNELVDDSFLEFEDAARLARIRKPRLRRWVTIGVVAPSRRLESPRRATVQQGFSLGDVGYLHLLHHLRDQRVTLHHAVEVMFHLMQRFGPPGETWQSATVTVANKRVIAFASDEWKATVAVSGHEGAGQRLALEILADILPSEITIETLLIPPQYLRNIEISARKENGLPVIRGTRLQTAMVRRLADRYGPETVIRDYYDHISITAVRACQAFEEWLDVA